MAIIFNLGLAKILVSYLCVRNAHYAPCLPHCASGLPAAKVAPPARKLE